MTFYTVAIGDIHGCFDQMKQLIEDVRSRYEVNKWVFLGDYIDRGPDSKKVLDFLMDRERKEIIKDYYIFLKGNHEEMMQFNEHYWSYNGGNETLKSFEVDNWHRIPKEYIGWIEKLDYYHDDGLRFFVHAGVTQKPPQHTSRNEMLWVRGSFLTSTKDWGRLIVHGHTPTYGKPQATPYRINLDTGCVFGQKLTAAVFVDYQVQPIEFIQVDGPKDDEQDYSFKNIPMIKKKE